MHPLRFWSLFLALATSAIVLFPRIAGARPEGPKRRPVARPVVVKIGRSYRAEIHAPHRCTHKAKRK